MTDSKLFQLYSEAEIRKKVYDYFANKQFNKISETLDYLLIYLDSSSKLDHKCDEINFISEISLKACWKLLKAHKVNNRLLEATSRLITTYSNSSRIICMSKINQAETFMVLGKFSDSRKSAKSCLKLSENCMDCCDLLPRLHLILSSCYLKTLGKYSLALKHAQKALDLCYRKLNSSEEMNYFKMVIESLYNMGIYYVKLLDFKQAESILQRVNEMTCSRRLCKHLTEKLKRLTREIHSLGANRSSDRKNSRGVKRSGSVEIRETSVIPERGSNTVFLTKTAHQLPYYKMINDWGAAVTIQSYYRMRLTRRKYLQRINRKLLKSTRKVIDGINFIFSALLDDEGNVIIEAYPLVSKIIAPKSCKITKDSRKSYGIENLHFISNLLSWISVINNKIFVSHRLNKRRLVYKGKSNLLSNCTFLVKVFETEDEVIVQALNSSVYDLGLQKATVNSAYLRSPNLLVEHIKFENNLIRYIN